MRSAKGNITITIYPDDPSHFLDGAYKVARQQLPVTLPVTSACFALPAPGHYAVALFQDENDNHHFDTNSLGIPTEGYGFSNNPTLYFGPPDLSRVRFSVHSGDNPIAIRMKYRSPSGYWTDGQPAAKSARKVQARAGQNAIYQAGATSGADITRRQDRRLDTAHNE